jgi:hypothetical protein
LEQEDIKWKQRAKQNWYQNGDQNTPFFHAWADHRRRVNQIRKINDESGRELKHIKEISKAFVGFYQRLFTSETSIGMDLCLADMRKYVTETMNDDLLKPFVVALGQMHPLKSLGSDGFSAYFYLRS